MGFNFHMLYRIGKSNSMDIFYGVSLRGGGDDKMCWKPSKRRGFEVRGYYRVLIRTSGSSAASLSYCYGVRIVWSSLGNAKDGYCLTSLLAR